MEGADRRWPIALALSALVHVAGLLLFSRLPAPDAWSADPVRPVVWLSSVTTLSEPAAHEDDARTNRAPADSLLQRETPIRLESPLRPEQVAEPGSADNRPVAAVAADHGEPGPPQRLPARPAPDVSPPRASFGDSAPAVLAPDDPLTVPARESTSRPRFAPDALAAPAPSASSSFDGSVVREALSLPLAPRAATAVDPVHVLTAASPPSRTAQLRPVIEPKPTMSPDTRSGPAGAVPAPVPRAASPSSPGTRPLAAVPRALPATQGWASNSRPSFPGALISRAGEHAPSSAPPPVDALQRADRPLRLVVPPSAEGAEPSSAPDHFVRAVPSVDVLPYPDPATPSRELLRAPDVAVGYARGARGLAHVVADHRAVLTEQLIEPLAAAVADLSSPLPEEQAIGPLLPADPGPEPVSVPGRNSPLPWTEPEQGPALAGHAAPAPAQTDPLPSPGNRDAMPSHGETGPAPTGTFRTGTTGMDLVPEWVHLGPAEGDGILPGTSVDFDVYVEPLYPRALRRRGIEGFVELIVHIDGEGRVIGWDMVDFGPDAAFKEEVERVVGRWRFSTPADPGAGAPPWHRRVRIEFRLE